MNASCVYGVNTLRPRQNGRHFADDIFKCIFLNENVWIPIKISVKFVPKGQINNIPALVQIMAWRRPGDKPLSEPMMVSLTTHICVTRPQWVNSALPSTAYIRWWTESTLVQVMACCLFGAKPLTEPIRTYCQLNIEKKNTVKYESAYKMFIQKNAFENAVCVMAAIFPGGMI